MEALQDFRSLQDKIQAALVATTKKVNLLASQDLAFRRSVDPDAAEQLDEQRTRLLNLAAALIEKTSRSANSKTVSLEDADDVEIHWRSIVDALDTALEKADTCIDEYTGLVKRKDTPTAEMGPQAKKPKSSGPLERSLRFANIVKPQKAFEVPPDNRSQGPWKPILTKKPHAIVPLEQSFGTLKDDNGETQYDYLLYLPLTVKPLLEEAANDANKSKNHAKKIWRLRSLGKKRDADGRPRYKHPYETEILQMRYPDGVYQTRDAIPCLPIAKTAPVYVDTLEGVMQMLEELKAADEIAVDLEHHDFRTYSGLLSLMQISTRHKDWVVDTLKPWRHRLEILNEVFADPRKLKVFHGAYMDIKWLQRDLGLYVVGLFDTFSAAEALRYPGKSLAYLLKKFVDFEADKRYQMADWRIRPLPTEMLYYARSDTHYLLYIYDMMRNELVSQSVKGDPLRDLVEITLQNSKKTSLFRYEAHTIEQKSGQGSRGWFNALSRVPPNFNSQQFSVFKAIHQWRDDLARGEDESPMFLMSHQVLVELSEHMPTSHADLHRLLHNAAHSIKASADALLRLIRDAREEGVHGPSLMDVLRADARAGPTADMTLGNIIRDVKTLVYDEDIPHAAEMKSKKSQLWGSVPLSSLWESVSEKLTLANREPIAIPWSDLVTNAQVATEGDIVMEEAKADDIEENGGAPLNNVLETQEATISNQEFTLRAGRPSGAKEMSKNASAASDTSSDGEEEEAEEEKPSPKRLLKEEKKHRKEERRLLKQKKKEEKKAARKAEKKALKQAKKAAATNEEGEDDDDDQEEGGGGDGDGDGEEEEPFDYSKAQSVMRGQRTAKATDAGGGAKVFDPYLNKTTADGPKAARRMNFEKAGRTATFKK